jgi:hypothetical protein
MLPELYRLLDPGPLGPSQSSYAVAPATGVHEKVTDEPGRVLPGAGLMNAAVVAADAAAVDFFAV